jgi:hypothetical protein
MKRLISMRQSLFALKIKIRAASPESPGFASASNAPDIAGLLQSKAVLDGKIRALEGRVRTMGGTESTFVHDITPIINAEDPPINLWRSVFPGAANLDAFQRAGHSLFALLAGLVSGTVALWFWERKERGGVGSAG